MVEARGGGGAVCEGTETKTWQLSVLGQGWGKLSAVGSWVEDKEGEAEPNLSLLPGGVDVNSALLI